MNVLLPVDRSAASVKTVQFVAKLLAGRTGDDQVVVFHVAEFLPEFILSDTPEAGLTSRTLAERWATKAKTDGEAVLAEQKQALLSAGLKEAVVQTKLHVTDCLPESKKVAAALSIIAEMQAGTYDLVCLGRGGASGMAASFIGSVAEKVLRAGQGRSVLVVD